MTIIKKNARVRRRRSSCRQGKKVDVNAADQQGRKQRADQQTEKSLKLRRSDASAKSV